MLVRMLSVSMALGDPPEIGGGLAGTLEARQGFSKRIHGAMRKGLQETGIRSPVYCNKPSSLKGYLGLL